MAIVALKLPSAVWGWVGFFLPTLTAYPLGAAVRFDPGLAEPHCNLGLALVKLGRMAEAQAQFAVALRIDPADPVAGEAGARLLPEGIPSP
jgi:hypothetical protein